MPTVPFGGFCSLSTAARTRGREVLICALCAFVAIRFLVRFPRICACFHPAASSDALCFGVFFLSTKTVEGCSECCKKKKKKIFSLRAETGKINFLQAQGQIKHLTAVFMWQATKCAVSAQKSSSCKNVCVQNTAVFMFCWAAEFHLQVKVFSANCGKSAQNRFGSTEAKCSLSCLLISAEHIESVVCSLEFQTDSLQLFALTAHTHY